jgi:hypothetical protein
VINRTPMVGDLRIEECMDQDLKRNVRTARLHDQLVVIAGAPPTLLDVHIIAMSPQELTLAGVERLEGESMRSRGWLRLGRRSLHGSHRRCKGLAPHGTRRLVATHAFERSMPDVSVRVPSSSNTPRVPKTPVHVERTQ